MSARREFGQLDTTGTHGAARVRDALLDCVAALVAGTPWREATHALLARIEADVPGARARLYDSAQVPPDHADAACRARPVAGAQTVCALNTAAVHAKAVKQAARVCSACHAHGRHRIVAPMGRHSERALMLDLVVRHGDDLAQAQALSLADALGAAAHLLEGLREGHGDFAGGERDAARALTRELHDSVAQQLGLISFVVSQIQQQMRRSEVSEALVGELRALVTRLQRQVRELITSARLTHDGRSLRQTLAASVEEFARRSNVVFEIDNRVPALALAPEVELHVLQIVRESLSNVVRHSHARHAWIELAVHARGVLRVGVTDDGVGLAAVVPDTGHYGLSILRERAQAIGAQIDIESVGEAGGTRIRLIVPGVQFDEEPPGESHHAAAD
ncbi:MAG TPA: ATP-binding protein [Paraburkholderia sp.]|jgi:two-component system nitrate/nitrite sensor histidine kinase NarX|uniref:sensor histidine kinase n=1 Tax=Paraburkholderia sp. TaxID=1926495 RepID=UPI002DECD09F|nr:ATP-binding protein [Paraburkholderia sp.]